jgi:PAS domain-containing protein
MPTAQGPPHSTRAGFDHEELTPVPLIQLLQQAPTPILITAKADHRITFANAPMASTLRRASAESLVGKPIRDALAEIECQPFFELLDQAFGAGAACSRTEFPLNFRGEETDSRAPAYLNFVLQPLRGVNGQVEGMMVQATDVTNMGD